MGAMTGNASASTAGATAAASSSSSQDLRVVELLIVSLADAKACDNGYSFRFTFENYITFI